MTVLELLNGSTRYLKSHSVKNPRLNSELLLCRALGISREQLYTRLHSEVGDEEKRILKRTILRRVAGEPLQYILGRQEFWSIDFNVDPRVLIPRPETEHLVEQALSLLSETPCTKTPWVLEIGTGSGAIVVSLAKEVKDIFLVATDLSLKALVLAEENARSAGVRQKIAFVNGDLFQPFLNSGGGGPFELILSNPPYIGRHDIRKLAREVRDHEPLLALDGGEEGLDFYRRIVAEGLSYLKEGGWLLLEVGQGQGSRVSELVKGKGDFLEPELLHDLAGMERVLKVQKKANTDRRRGA